MSATSASDLEKASGKLSVRQASAADLEAFLVLARMCVEETGKPFDEDAARWLFGGIARADPAIHLLLDDSKVVGFAIVRTFCTPLTKVAAVYQEVVFVRADKRSGAAELLLHAMTIEVFKTLPALSEVSLVVCPSPHAPSVVEELRSAGLGGEGLENSELRLKAVRVPSRPAEDDLKDKPKPETLH